jgi:hypothetical protein
MAERHGEDGLVERLERIERLLKIVAGGRQWDVLQTLVATCTTFATRSPTP